MTAQPILPRIACGDGIYLQITNLDSDDFLRRQTCLKASAPDGTAVVWRLPDRLMLNEDVCRIAAEEIVTELQERLERKRQITTTAGRVAAGQ